MNQLKLDHHGKLGSIGHSSVDCSVVRIHDLALEGFEPTTFDLTRKRLTSRLLNWHSTMSMNNFN